MTMIAALVALLVYLPIGCAAVIEAHEERCRANFAAHGFTPGDHRQYKRWLP